MQACSQKDRPSRHRSRSDVGASGGASRSSFSPLDVGHLTAPGTRGDRAVGACAGGRAGHVSRARRGDRRDGQRGRVQGGWGRASRRDALPEASASFGYAAHVTGAPRGERSRLSAAIGESAPSNARRGQSLDLRCQTGNAKSKKVTYGRAKIHGGGHCSEPRTQSASASTGRAHLQSGRCGSAARTKHSAKRRAGDMGSRA